MKKLDKLILSSFIGPFILTFVVVDFILLTQYMLKYFDEFVGKNLGITVFLELIMYFCINMSPKALPLAVLLSSLMTFGNLGEHFELTAIKGSGISLVRAMAPLFVFVVLLTTLAYYSNNYIVPRANLKAYRLLYDIRHTKPSLDIKEGVFYNGIPKFSIKVNKKYPDEITLKDLIIYDHSKGLGNNEIILADSGKMYTFSDERYLMLELFNGNKYSESSVRKKGKYGSGHNIKSFTRINFDHSKLVFSLASFDFKQTKEELFASNRLMKNTHQLSKDIDSMQWNIFNVKYRAYYEANTYYDYHLKNGLDIPLPMQQKKIIYDSLFKSPKSDPLHLKYSSALLKTDNSTVTIDSMQVVEKVNVKLSTKGSRIAKNKLRTSKKYKHRKNKGGTKNKKQNRKATRLSKYSQTKAMPQKKVSEISDRVSIQPRKDIQTTDYTLKPELRVLDSIFDADKYKGRIIKNALLRARKSKNIFAGINGKLQKNQKDINKHEVEKYKKFSEAFACMVMFLIGAPLGSIIKRGGLGIPVILSIGFFIVYYVLSIIGGKWSKGGIIDPIYGIWGANIILLPMGLFFLRQARNDVRLFEADFYNVVFAKFQDKLKTLKVKFFRK
ncbi:MAG: LptF/LptG family permease [Bacteroidetes bacterium]|nr:LptF/LptG family permease [Bacteroidota bacterium]